MASENSSNGGLCKALHSKFSDSLLLPLCASWTEGQRWFDPREKPCVVQWNVSRGKKSPSHQYFTPSPLSPDWPICCLSPYHCHSDHSLKPVRGEDMFYDICRSEKVKWTHAVFLNKTIPGMLGYMKCMSHKSNTINSDKRNVYHLLGPGGSASMKHAQFW